MAKLVYNTRKFRNTLDSAQFAQNSRLKFVSTRDGLVLQNKSTIENEIKMAEDYPENLILAAELLKFAKNKLVSLELDENGNNLTLTLPIPERFVKIVKNAQQVLNGQPVEAHSGGTNEYEWTLRLVSGLGGQPDLVTDAGAQITCKFCHEAIDGGEENYLEHLE